MTGQTLAISLLGPIEVRRDGELVRVGGTKPRVVLAMLALQVGRVVSVDALTEALWQDDPPATASASLQVHVSALRRALDPPEQTSCIINRAPGYLLDLDPSAVDLIEFERLCEAGRALASEGRDVEAAAQLRTADALWRGEALADLAGEHATIGPAAALEEARLSAVESRIGADLRRGAHAEVTPELRLLVGAHPLREDLWAALMLALYRSGRQGEALAAYRDARSALVEELGLDPGPALQALEQDVLAQSPDLDWQPSSHGSPRVVPLDTTIIGDRSTAPPALLIWSGGQVDLSASSCTIGRHPDSTIVLDDAKASRHHAAIRPVNGGHLLTDLGSTNGTLVDGDRVNEITLRADADITIGATVLRYTLT